MREEIYEISQTTTATATMEGVTYTISSPASMGLPWRLREVWLTAGVAISANAGFTVHGQVQILFPSTVTGVSRVMELAEGWLRAALPDVGTVPASGALTDTIRWQGDMPLIEVERPAPRPVDATIRAFVTNASGASVVWILRIRVVQEDPDGR